MNLEPILQTAKILTSNKLPDRFLDTKIYEPTDPEESVFGNTYILVEVTTPWFPTAKITKLIRNTFLEEYYHTSVNRFEVKRFEDGLKAVNKKLSELAGAGQIEWIGNLNAIIAVISHKKLYLSHTGTAEAYLFRKNKISHITSDEEAPKNPTPIQTFAALINGDLEQEDRLVLSNSEMFNFVSIDTLRNAVEQISPNSAVDEVANILYREKADKVNAIFIYLSSDNAIDAKVATTLPDTIFLDSPEVTGLVWKHGFKPKNIFGAAKKYITFIGFGVLTIISFFSSLFRRKNQDEIEIQRAKLKNEPAQDLSYMTSSIDLNLSHIRDKTKKTNSTGIFSVFAVAWSWLRGLNKKWLYGGIALIIILLVASGIYLRIHSQAKTNADFATIVSAAQDKINSAETQSALHNNDGARGLLQEARTMLNDIKDKPKSPVEVVLLLDRIQTDLDKVNNISRIDSPKELANLSSLVSGIDTNNLIYLDGALYAVNIKGPELLVTIVDKGDKKVLTKIPSDAGEIQTLATYDNDKILVLETNKGRIFEFSLQTNKLEEKPNSQGIAYPDANVLGTYLSTLYLLDKNEGVMQKFAHSGSGYDKGRDVFRAGLFNLKDVNSFAIDGNIYLLFDNGALQKTLKGSVDTNFKLKNIPEPDSNLDSPNQIVTTLDSTSLYILENKKHRIIELNKNGDYLRQFVFKDSIGTINSFAINEKTKKLYLLADNKISQIDL